MVRPFEMVEFRQGAFVVYGSCMGCMDDGVFGLVMELKD